MSEARDDSAGQGRPRPGSGWGLLLVLAAVQFTHIIDLIILMPLGPRYMREFDVTPGQFSVLVSAYALSACASGLLAATFIDRFDRKRALLVLYGGFALGTLLCAVAAGYGALLLGRCVAGAFGGVLGGLCMAMVGDAFPEERRGRATGVLMWSFSAAAIAGLPAGLYLSDRFGTSAPFAVLAALSAVLLALAAVLLPPLRHHVGSGPATSPWRILLWPAHLRAYALVTCVMLGTAPLIPLLATYLVTNVGWSESALPWVYLTGGVATVFSLSLVGRLADRFGKRPVYRVLALLSVAAVLLMTNLPPVSLAAGLAVTTLFMVITSGRMVPAMALVTSSARPAYRGSFQSVVASVQQASMSLGALAGGTLVSQPVKDGPLEGFPLAGLFGCGSLLLSVVLAGAVRPAEETAAEEALPEVVEAPL